MSRSFCKYFMENRLNQPASWYICQGNACMLVKTMWVKMEKQTFSVVCIQTGHQFWKNVAFDLETKCTNPLFEISGRGNAYMIVKWIVVKLEWINKQCSLYTNRSTPNRRKSVAFNLEMKCTNLLSDILSQEERLHVGEMDVSHVWMNRQAV